MDQPKLEEISKELMKATLNYVKAAGWPSGCPNCTPNLKYDPDSSLNPCKHVSYSDFDDSDSDSECDCCEDTLSHVGYKKEDKKYYIRQTSCEDGRGITHQYVSFHDSELPKLIKMIWKAVEKQGDKYACSLISDMFVQLTTKAKKRSEVDIDQI